MSIAAAPGGAGSLPTLTIHDHLRAGANAELIKFLYSCSKQDACSAAPCSITPSSFSVERVEFSDQVTKINRRDKRQGRTLIITDRAIYNFKPGTFKSAKRRIRMHEVRGLVLSRTSDEMLVQVLDSYDYRFAFKRRSEAVQVLSDAYARVHAQEGEEEGPQLLVQWSDESELKDICITKEVLKNLQQVAAVHSLHGAPSHGGTNVHRRTFLQTSDSESSETSRTRAATTAVTGSGGWNIMPRSTSYSLSYGSPNSPSFSAHKHATHSQPPSKQLLPSPTLGPAASPRAAHSKGNTVDEINEEPEETNETNENADTQSNHANANANGSTNDPESGEAAQHEQEEDEEEDSGPVWVPPRPQLKPQPLGSRGFPLLASHIMQRAQQAQSGALPTIAKSSYLASRTNKRAANNASPNPALSPSSSHSSNASSCATPLSSGQYPAARRGASKTVVGNQQSNGLHSFRDPSSRLEGWLTKQKGSRSRWDRKYFLLTSTHLHYYQPRIKGNVKLRPKVTVERVHSDISTGGPNETSAAAPKSLIMLRIDCGGGSMLGRRSQLMLAFGSMADADHWTSAILERNTVLPPLEMDNYTHVEGWVLKKVDGAWVRTYVVLTQDRVWFIEMFLKGSVDFRHGISAHSNHIVQPTEEASAHNFAGKFAVSRFSYRWSVSDNVRVFHLASDTEEDMNRWIAAVEQANREYGRETSGGAQSAEDEQEELQLAQSMQTLMAPSQVELPTGGETGGALEPAPEGNVTLVFTDVQSSTNLWEKVPDAMDAALAQHDRLLRELLQLYRGYEVKTVGDAFMCAFFTPLEAYLWCAHVQIALLDAEWSQDFTAMPSAAREEVNDPDSGETVLVFNGIRIRMGIHTGFPACRRNPVTGRMDYFGNPVNKSARVSDTGHGGQIVCTMEVVDALRQNMNTEGSVRDPRLSDGALLPIISDQGEHELKGIKEPVRIFELMPERLRLRKLPPIRTINNERLEKEKEAEEAAAAAAAANKGGGGITTAALAAAASFATRIF